MPRVSIVLVTRNRPQFLAQAVESVFRQTFTDWELIVVDDGSTPPSDLVGSGAAGTIKQIYQPHLGRSQARNTGLNHSTGELIAFLDDDDVWYPNKLEKQLEMFEAFPRVGLVHSLIEVVDSMGRPLAQSSAQHLELYKRSAIAGYTYCGMSLICTIFTSTVMVRAEVLPAVGAFDTALDAFEDWDFYLRVSRVYQIRTIWDRLTRYRLHAEQSDADDRRRGRLAVAAKHVALTGTEPRARANFHAHAGAVRYMTRDWMACREQYYSALAADVSIALRWPVLAHLIVATFPTARRLASAYRHVVRPSLA